MTHIRRQVRNGNTYLYSAKTFRDRDTGKVRQKVKYLGKEVERNGKRILKPSLNRKEVRRVLDSGAYVLYRIAQDDGILMQYEDSLDGLTGIRDAAKKIVILAAECIMGQDHSIYLHTGIQKMSDKEIRDVVDLVGRKDPDTIAMLEKSIAPQIIREFGSSGIVYDLSAIRYYGTENDLARYGHYYHLNGENREINFVLAVTRKGGIPVHHRPIAGSIPSVLTVKSFIGELKDFGAESILIVMDRGFYSSENIRELKDYGVIGAIPSSLTIHDEMIRESKDIENSSNYFQYEDETVFLKEKRIRGLRYIVFFSPRLRTRKLESFYYALSEKEKNLDALKGKKFQSGKDLVRTVEEELKGFGNFFDVKYDLNDMAISFKLKHNAIQRKTNRFGYTILLTNTSIPNNELLRIYRENDAVEKAFSHLKPHLEPFFSRSERGTRARLFLVILGYTLVAVMASKCGIKYNEALKAASGIREVVYSSGGHAPVEYTKEQRELLEKLKITL
ncbi:MAG: hypothetical protein M0Z77_09635 [Thermoplasmatales archaeon]|nr:hypothetical protein [Candidatus Thermoplasmatota archaeon]MCL6002398.1 hypothetical protein [Candidatus Thermoplasmatota archaeon]MDA8055887.1 hypothetical protein [Thermoplasmatales archaeon]